MNPTIKQQWISALLSGKYKQGKGALRPESDTYCCLGVLCDLHLKSLNKEWRDSESCNGFTEYYALNERAILPKETMDWAGLEAHNDNVVYLYDNTIGHTNLAKENDDEASFKQIAALIKNCL
jgi:hypothetical protein